MRMLNLDGLLPGEVGWVCACDAEVPHPLVKGAWNVAADVCGKRLPAFRLHEQLSERIPLAVEAVA